MPGPATNIPAGNSSLTSDPQLVMDQGIHTSELLPNPKTSATNPEPSNQVIEPSQTTSEKPSEIQTKSDVPEIEPKEIMPDPAPSPMLNSQLEFVTEQKVNTTECLPDSKTTPEVVSNNETTELNNVPTNTVDPSEVNLKPSQDSTIDSKEPIPSLVENNNLQEIKQILASISNEIQSDINTKESEGNSLKEETPNKSEDIKATQTEEEKQPDQEGIEKHESAHSQSATEVHEETNETTTTDSQTTESENSKKAIELVVETSSFNEESEEKEIDINELSKQIFGILEEGTNEETNEDLLKKKNDDLKDFIIQLIRIIKDKTELCYKLEKQNEALIQQAKSLKNVIAITKDLLGIRNMEVEHLHEDMKLLEENISAERTRHDLLLQKLAESLKINESLKAEYHKQQGLFQSLREKYHEKIILLTRENQRLNNLVNSSNEEATQQENGEGINGSDTISTETVEK